MVIDHILEITKFEPWEPTLSLALLAVPINPCHDGESLLGASSTDWTDSFLNKNPQHLSQSTMNLIYLPSWNQKMFTDHPFQIYEYEQLSV